MGISHSYQMDEIATLIAFARNDGVMIQPLAATSVA